jgi:hypothetical protein
MAPHTLANSEKNQNRKIMASFFWDRKVPLLINFCLEETPSMLLLDVTR